MRLQQLADSGGGQGTPNLTAYRPSHWSWNQTVCCVWYPYSFQSNRHCRAFLIRQLVPRITMEPPCCQLPRKAISTKDHAVKYPFSTISFFANNCDVSHELSYESTSRRRQQRGRRKRRLGRRSAVRRRKTKSVEWTQRRRRRRRCRGGATLLQRTSRTF